MKISTLLYLLVFLPGVIKAQTNYHPGYIINLNGDTTRGAINYREWSLNPDQVEFRADGTNGSVIQLNPAGIRSFVIDDQESYLSYTGAVSADKTQSTNSIYGHDVKLVDTTKISRSVFLRLLATGKNISLYTYIDKDKIRFFFTEGIKAPAELEYHEFYDEDKHEIKTVEVFKSQLIALAGRYSSDPTMIDQIQSLKYNSTDLQSYTDKLNKVSSVLRKANHRSSTHFFFGISADATTTHYDKQLRTDLYNHSAHTTVMPGINAGFDVYLNPNVQRFIFRADLSLSYNQPSYTYTYTDNLFTVNQKYAFNQFTVSVSPKLIYNLYNTNKLKFFIGAGASFNYSLYSNNMLTTTNTNGTYSGSTENKDPFALHPVWVGFPLMTGIKLKQKLEISLTYFPTSLYSENNAYAVGNSRISLGLSFNLTGK